MAIAGIGQNLRLAPPANQEAMPPSLVIKIPDDDSQPIKMIDAKTGAVTYPQEDGSAIVKLDGEVDETKQDKRHDANLAESMEMTQLGMIAERLLQGIDEDLRSREEWVQTRNRGLELLGVKIEPPRQSSGDTAAPMEGMSSIRHPLLLEAVLRFQANAQAELLPANGPVKVRSDATPLTGLTPEQQLTMATQTQKDEMAEALEKDFNHYLTAVATEYYPDTDRMLFMLGAGGCSFKKVYHHPLKQRPTSESVDANDLIVNNNATDLESATRITHRIVMPQNVMRRMQLLGIYRDVPLGQPQYTPDPTRQKVSEIQGILQTTTLPEDQPFTVYETLAEVDLPGYEHKKKGKATGLALPYKVTIDRDSRQILDIRRNWKKGDETYKAKEYFVKWPFVPGLGFYDLGFIHILGNTTQALTAAWRELIDAGMFANFPGFLHSTSLNRQTTNNFRVAPGQGRAIDTGGLPIGDAVMSLPYKDVSVAFQQFIAHIAETGMRVGGTSELPVGEGRSDAPVGTTLALLEQATKIVAAAHKRQHAAQSKEFMLLRERFKEDPESFWRFNKRPQLEWKKEQLIKALDDYDLVPAADPNTPSHMHRIMKAVAIKQLEATKPTLYDPIKVESYVLKVLGIEDPYSLFQAPQAAQPSPEELAIMANVEILKGRLQLDTKKMQVEAITKGKELQIKEREVGIKEKEAGIGAKEKQARIGIDMSKLLLEGKRAAEDGMSREEESAAERAARGADSEAERAHRSQESVAEREARLGEGAAEREHRSTESAAEREAREKSEKKKPAKKD